MSAKLIKCKSCNGEIARDARVCPHCGSKVRKHKTLGIVLTVLGVFILIGAIGGSGNKEVKNSSTPGSAAVETGQTEADRKERAAMDLLDSAKADFDEGRYSSAFSKCDKVRSDYSDTDVAMSVDSFLSDLYDTAINVTAFDLHSAYDANQVSADNAYKDKAIVITGTVSDIGKNIFSQTYITLKDGSDYGLTSIQCFFDGEQESSIGETSKGNSVKLIGKCVGENLMNVQINNCYLIG